MRAPLDLSVGILAWKSGKTLIRTLSTYQTNGLLELVDDVVIFFQEVSEEDVRIAERFGVRYHGSRENVGIDQGFVALAEAAKHGNILLLEHDWNLVEGRRTTEARLRSGVALLDRGYHVVRYRHRRRPGEPHYSFTFRGRELDYYDEWHECTSPHLLDSLHWLEPDEAFPDKIQKEGEYFVTTSRWGNWTNNPCMFRKPFYLDVVKPLKGEKIDLERKIARWWPRQGFRVAHGEGLFMHNDIGKHPPKSLPSRAAAGVRKLIRRWRRRS